MEIFFKDELIGKMENSYKEQFWLNGDFMPNNAYFKYKDFLDALVCEEGMDETKFSPELFDENNWSIKIEKDVHEIYPPAIYADGSISIRYNA
jgi:hypothetical protein